jgi:hypothetical protein
MAQWIKATYRNRTGRKLRLSPERKVLRLTIPAEHIPPDAERVDLYYSPTGRQIAVEFHEAGSFRVSRGGSTQCGQLSMRGAFLSWGLPEPDRAIDCRAIRADINGHAAVVFDYPAAEGTR